MQDATRGIQNIGQTMQFVKGIGDQYQDFKNRQAILEQLSKLGGPAQAAPVPRTPQQEDQLLAMGEVDNPEAMASFSQFAQETIGQPKEVVDAKAVERIAAGEAEGRNMSDTRQLIALPQEQQQLAIGNINQMIKNKAVRDYMARNPEGATKFLESLGVTGMGGNEANYQFGSQSTIKDSDGNIFTVTQRRDPNTGKAETVYAPVGDAPDKPVGKIEVAGAYGLTSGETVGFKGDVAKEQNRQEQISKGAQNAFEKVNTINMGIDTIDTAIQALDDGANVGALADYLPSFKASTKAFENARNRMGLDVISSVTFGALSKSELDIAMATAIPKGLSPEGARTFLLKKKAAQEKLRNFYEQMAQDSLELGLTPAELMVQRSKERRAQRAEQSNTAKPSGQSAADRLKAAKAKAGY